MTKILYPWLMAGIKPEKTIRYVSNRASTLLLFILTLLLLWTSSSHLHYYLLDYTIEEEYLYMVQVFVGVFVIGIFFLITYVLAKLLGGKASAREVFLVILLFSMPLTFLKIFSLFSINFSILVILFALFILWSMVIYILMLSEVERFSIWKAVAIVSILFVVEIFLPPTIVLQMADKYYDFNPKSQIALIQTQIDANRSSTKVVLFTTVGYERALKSREDFLVYNNAILRLFSKGWTGNSMAGTSTIWIENLNAKKLDKNSFDTFFNQLESLDKLDKDENTTWGLLSLELPVLYVEFMDKELEILLDSEVKVPIVKLFTKDEEVIETLDMSRAYLISELYKRMSEFCEEAENVVCSANKYAKKAVEVSSLNPAALFRYAYTLDDDKLEVELLEKLLSITTKSKRHVDVSESSIYNNLAYAIYMDEQKEKYDEALVYLKKSYALDDTAVYSLATISSIYLERNESKNSYEALEAEVYKFFNESDDELEGKERTYWTFVRHLIGTSYQFKDYETTRYACDKYLKLKNNEYDSCKEKLEVVEDMNSSSKALYSFWHLKIDPKAYLTELNKKNKIVFKNIFNVMSKLGEHEIKEEELKSYFYFSEYLLEKNLLIGIDWKGESSEGELQEFIEKHLSLLGIENFSWDFYVEFLGQYDFSTAEDGDYIIDLFELMAFELDKVGVVLGEFDTYTDTYMLFLAKKNEFEKIETLRGLGWEIDQFEFEYDYDMYNTLKK